MPPFEVICYNILDGGEVKRYWSRDLPALPERGDTVRIKANSSDEPKMYTVRRRMWDMVDGTPSQVNLGLEENFK